MGKPIRFAELPANVAALVAGVANEEFDTPHGADFFVARRVPHDDVNHGQDGFMRLKPGASIAHAENQMAAVMAGLAKDGASKLPRLDAVAFSGRVLLFALAALVVSGVLVGLAPAIRLARTDVRALMNESTRSATSGRGTTRWLSVMTVAEIALAIMLVAGAGWLVRGFSNLRNTDTGFVADQRVIFDISFVGEKYRAPNAVHMALNDLSASLGAVHGVSRVGATSGYPMRGTLEGSLLLQFHGEAMDPSSPRGTRQRFVTPGLFAAMGTRVLQGRGFGPEDTPTSQRTAIINRTFATRYLAGRNQIGVQFSAGYPAPNPANEVTVVGVVDDVRQKSLSDVAEPAFYLPHAQTPLRRMTMVVSTSVRDVARSRPRFGRRFASGTRSSRSSLSSPATWSDRRFAASSSG